MDDDGIDAVGAGFQVRFGTGDGLCKAVFVGQIVFADVKFFVTLSGLDELADFFLIGRLGIDKFYIFRYSADRGFAINIKNFIANLFKKPQVNGAK